MELVLKKLQNGLNLNHQMSRHMDKNQTDDQCDFKGTQVPLESWDQVFLIKYKGDFKRRKLGNTKKRVFRFCCLIIN